MAVQSELQWADLKDAHLAGLKVAWMAAQTDDALAGWSVLRLAEQTVAHLANMSVAGKAEPTVEHWAEKSADHWVASMAAYLGWCWAGRLALLLAVY